jgi:hypothetical protein
MTRLLVLPLLLVLAGCSMTLPVTGLVQSTGENFAGTATGHMDSAGELTITSSKGATCGGTFVYTTRREGEGTFKCSDGRSGPFSFVSTGARGTGHGTIDGQPITFDFGK